MRNAGPAPASPAAVKLDPEESARYLQVLFAERFPGATNAPPSTPPPDPAEIRRRLLEKVEVSEDDLRLLATERARRVQDCLGAAGKVEPERIFLKAADAAEETTAAAASKVYLNLR